MARLVRRRDVKVAEAGGAIELSGAGNIRARGRVSLDSWDGVSVEERMSLLRRKVERLETSIDELHDRVDAEAEQRTAGQARLEQASASTRLDLEAKITDAATGGLRLETLRVLLFGLGLALSTIGNLLA